MPVVLQPPEGSQNFIQKRVRNLEDEYQKKSNRAEKNAEKEVNLFFDETELIGWTRSTDAWIRE